MQAFAIEPSSWARLETYLFNFQGTYEKKKNLEYVILYHMGKMQLMDASKDLITFKSGTSADIVPGLLELLLKASEQQGGP